MGFRRLAVCLLAVAAVQASGPGELDNLYQTNEWFRFRDAVASPDTPAFYRGLAAAAFYDLPAALEILGPIAKSAPEPLQQFEAAMVVQRLYMMEGRRREAETGIPRSMPWIASSARQALEHFRRELALFGHFPDQAVATRQYSRVPYASDGGRDIIISASVNGRQAEFYLDTGSTECFISEKEARRLGLQIEPAELTVEGYGAHQKGTTTGVALAAELSVGEFRLRNVAFLVGKDDDDPAILGLPVLLAFRTIRWNADFTLEIGFGPQPRDVRAANLCFADGQLVTQVGFGKEKISMLLDTGADQTVLFPRFSAQFASFLKAWGKVQPYTITEGEEDPAATMLDEVRLRVGGAEREVRRVPALARNGTDTGAWSYGNLGLDYLVGARSVTLDFQAMRLIVDGGPASDPSAVPAPEGLPTETAGTVSTGATDVQAIMKRSVENDWFSYEVPHDYVFTEDTENRLLDVDGHVTHSSTETREAMALYDQLYERLTRKDGKPLPPGKERAEQQKFDKALYQREHESPAAKTKRELAEKRAQEQQRVCGAEFARIFNFKLLGAEVLNGRPAWVVEATPIPTAKPECDANKMAQKMHLRLWIDQAEFRWVRTEGDNVAPLTWGKMLVRAPAGTAHISFDQVRLPDATWLPAKLRYRFNVKLLLVATVRGEVVTTYGNYRKFHTDSRIIP